MTYLIKTRNAIGNYATTDQIKVTPFETHKVKRTGHIPGLGSYNEIEHKGWDRKRLTIIALKPTWAAGYARDTAERAVCDNTAAGLKSVLRKLRPQEAERLTTIDAEIEALKQAIGAKRRERKLVVREAWSKAHVVRLNEIEVVTPGKK